MGYSWTFKDEKGRDLLEQFEPSPDKEYAFHRAMYLGPDPSDKSNAPYSRSDIQLACHTDDAGGVYGDEAKEYLKRAQQMVRDNMDYLISSDPKEDDGEWADIDRMYAFLSIPIDRVNYFSGGY